MDRLTSDSIAAVNAGMTYGKWKALHPHTEVKNEVPVKGAKPCKVCGKVIPKRASTSGRQRKLYCSSECAYEAYREQMRARYTKKEDKADGKI